MGPSGVNAAPLAIRSGFGADQGDLEGLHALWGDPRRDREVAEGATVCA